MVIVEKLVEWRLARETEVLGENLPQRHMNTLDNGIGIFCKRPARSLLLPLYLKITTTDDIVCSGATV
jgi:hypothetical protein